MHARTHAHTRARMHAHAHACMLSTTLGKEDAREDEVEGTYARKHARMQKNILIVYVNFSLRDRQPSTCYCKINPYAISVRPSKHHKTIQHYEKTTWCSLRAAQEICLFLLFLVSLGISPLIIGLKLVN